MAAGDGVLLEHTQRSDTIVLLLLSVWPAALTWAAAFAVAALMQPALLLEPQLYYTVQLLPELFVAICWAIPSLAARAALGAARYAAVGTARARGPGTTLA